MAMAWPWHGHVPPRRTAKSPIMSLDSRSTSPTASSSKEQDVATLVEDGQAKLQLRVPHGVEPHGQEHEAVAHVAVHHAEKEGEGDLDTSKTDGVLCILEPQHMTFSLI